MTPIKLALSALLMIAFSLLVNAQKLPDKQPFAGVLAPTNIKIDGKATEWNDAFHAYNEANRIWYTVSNDDKNVYLIVRTKGLFGNEKIMMGGLTFTVRSAKVKTNKDKDAKYVSVTFPVMENPEDLKTIIVSSEKYRRLRNDITGNQKSIDSLQFAINKTAGTVFKEMQVLGIKGVDSVISIYNETGIHAAASFSNKIEYTYELAIPLKYLENTINSDGKFSYNIKQNGPPTDNSLNSIMFVNAGGVLMRLENAKVILGISPESGGPDDSYRFFSTDFWGEYTLAKK